MKTELYANNTMKKSFNRLMSNSTFPALGVTLILIIVNVALQPNFFHFNPLVNMFKTITPLVLVSMGQAIILISGSVDLSIGAALSLCVVIASSLFRDSVGNIVLVLFLMVAVAVASGGLNGLLVGKFRLPPLISTFATQAIFFGIAMYIMPIPGGYVPTNIYRFYNKNLFGFLPASVFILLIGIAIWFILSKTKVYKYIYAVGSNEEGASNTGIKVSRVRLIAHIFAGVFVAIAAICLLMMFASGDARSGLGYTMNSIAAVVIGGIALTGGKGSVPGAILGGISLSLLTNIIYYTNLSSLYQNFAKGMIIVLTLSIASIPTLIEKKHKV